MAENANNIRRGNYVRIDGVNFKVLDYNLNTPGNLRSIITLKLKNLETGANISKRFSANDSLETVYFSKRNCQYLYPEGDRFVFMDNETYEQFSLGKDVVGENMVYVPLNTDVQILTLDEVPADMELPAAVTLEVTEAEPAIRGDTATNVTKRAVTNTGLEIKVPQHINVGERISVDTRTGDFLGRAKD